MVKRQNLNLEFPFMPFFVLAVAFVLLIFTLSPYYQASKFSCPQTKHINCMPGPGPDKPQCQKEYLDWVKQNCPDFKGVAY